MEEFEIKGFDYLYIRDSPMGSVLNKDNADSYDAKGSDSWISDDRCLLIQQNSEVEYELFGLEIGNSLVHEKGNLEFILSKVSDYYNNLNNK